MSSAVIIVVAGHGNTDYHRAADIWLENHFKKTVLCLVQFKDIEVAEMPKMFIATPKEISEQLKKARNNKGDTILRQYKKWIIGVAKGTTEKIPGDWEFSEKRIQDLSSEGRNK